MAIALGNISVLATASRNAMANAFNTLVNTGAGTASIRLLNGATVLVTFPLPNPAFGAAATGTITLLGTPINATAVAGTATIPNGFEIVDRGGAVVASGPVTTGDAITSGQTVTLSSYTLTVNAS
jgi:hypothetical protein